MKPPIHPSSVRDLDIETMEPMPVQGLNPIAFDNFQRVAAVHRAEDEHRDGEALADRKVSEQLAYFGTEAMYMPPREFVEFLRRDQEQWERVAREAGVSFDD